MPKKQPSITRALMEHYLTFLREQERSKATIQKYTHDLNAFLTFAGKEKLSKSLVIAWKQALTATHAPASVNSMLAAVNGGICAFSAGERSA